MEYPTLRSGHPLDRLRRLASRWCAAGLPLLGLGCGPLAPALGPESSPAAGVCVARGTVEETSPPCSGSPEDLAPRVVPISLDTVLRLAEEQNPQIGIARARVDEACGERAVAGTHWLPDIYIGPAFYRHEGGIQDFTGRLIHSSYGAFFGGMEVDARFDIREVAFGIVSAERKTWQQKGELSKVTTETLLDAASTYIDLLAARTGLAIARDLEKKMDELLERTEKLARTEPGVQVEVERIQAELAGHHLSMSRLEDQSGAASAKLVYLLGLDPCVELLPIDTHLVPIELTDLSQPVCELVERALQCGPGIREMNGLLALVAESMEKAQGPGRLLPIFEVRMAEGAFGAGPGASSSWDNRWDLGVQARWNLSEFAALHQRRQVTLAKLQQLHLGHDDLRRKLAVGVQQMYSEILAGRTQLGFSEQQITHAREAHAKSKQRLENNIVGATPSEVTLSIQGLARAQLNYLSTVRDYNKDQIRLLLLLGPACCAETCPAAQ